MPAVMACGADTGAASRPKAEEGQLMRRPL